MNAPKHPRGSGGCVLYPGSPVRVHGLKSATDLNGKEGVAESWDPDAGRIHVRLLNGELRAIKLANVQKIRQSADDDEYDHEMQRVLDIFQHYDTNGDGVVDTKEFTALLKGLGMSESCLRSFLLQVDKDGDGEIQYEEFLTWCMEPSAKTKRRRAQIYWPEKHAPDLMAAESKEDLSAQDASLEHELSQDDLERLVGPLPDGWPAHGMTVVNNMRSRFPEYPLEGIMWMMNRNSFHGGKVLAAIRATGAKEVEGTPPTAIKLGKGGSLPATYRVRMDSKAMKVYRQGGSNWSFKNLRDGKLPSIGSFDPLDRFELLEVRRGHEYGFCFGRVKWGKSTLPHWVDLGLEVHSSHWTRRDDQCTARDMQFTEAERQA